MDSVRQRIWVVDCGKIEILIGILLIAFVNLSITDASPFLYGIGTLGFPCHPLPALFSCDAINSLCINNTCMCAPNYRPLHDQCVSMKNYGRSTLDKPCSSEKDCSGMGEYCSKYGYCRCLATHVSIDGRCKPVIYPGQLGCEDTRQCSRAFSLSYCFKRKCTCPKGLFLKTHYFKGRK